MANQSNFPTALDAVPTDKASGDTVPSSDWNTYFDGVYNLEAYVGISGTAVASSLTYVQDTLTQAISADRSSNIRLASGGGAGNVDITLYFATDAYILWDEADDMFKFPKAINLASGTPASSGASGVQGEISWDANFIYVCTAANTWKRAAIAGW